MTLRQTADVQAVAVTVLEICGISIFGVWLQNAIFRYGCVAW